MPASTPPSSWWETHDRAQRDASVLLVVASTICAVYLATAVVIVLAMLRVGKFGPWRGIETARHRVGALGVAGLAIGFVAVAALTIVCVSRLALGAHVVRRAGGRSPRADEAQPARTAISNVALGLGLVEPRLSIVDDPAVNALATGRARDPRIELTSGALRLSAEELEALCAHSVTAVSQPAGLLAGAAAAVLLDADWCTRFVWGLAGVVFVSGVAGAPTDAVAIAVLGIAILVAVTKPLVVISLGAMVRLLDCTAELTDLETVRVTNQPKQLALLMLDVIEHRTPVTSKWDIAHLWFDPETMAPTPSWWFPNVRPLAGADSARTRAALIDRARVLIDLAGHDSHLQARLEHAARSAAPRG